MGLEDDFPHTSQEEEKPIIDRFKEVLEKEFSSDQLQKIWGETSIFRIAEKLSRFFDNLNQLPESIKDIFFGAL